MFRDGGSGFRVWSVGIRDNIGEMEIFFFFVCSGPFPARRPCLREIGVYGLGLRDLPVDPETLLLKRLYYDLVFCRVWGYYGSEIQDLRFEDFFAVERLRNMGCASHG